MLGSRFCQQQKDLPILDTSRSIGRPRVFWAPARLTSIALFTSGDLSKAVLEKFCIERYRQYLAQSDVCLRAGYSSLRTFDTHRQADRYGSPESCLCLEVLLHIADDGNAELFGEG